MYLDENGEPIKDPEYLNDYGELPGDPRTRIPPEVAPEAAPTSWVEAMFPRASAAINEGRGAGTASAMDFYSLPWRASAAGVQTGAQALGAAMTGSPNDQETFREAMARTGGSSQDPRFVQAIDQIVRAPENTFLAPAGFASAALPAWLAKFAPAWVRGTAAGVELGANTGSRSMKAVQGATKAAPASAAVGASSQGERISSGRPVSPMEAASLTGLGLIGGGLGPGMEAVGGKLKRGGVELLRQVVKPTTNEVEGFYKAMDAGLLPEAAGAFTMTPGGAGERYIGRMKMRTEDAYAPAVAEAERTGATVNMNRAMGEANDFLRSEADAGRIALGEQDIRNTGEWLGEKLLYRDAPGRAALADAIKRRTIIPAVERPVVQAHRLKSAMQEVAYPGKDPRAIAPASGMTTAAKGADRAIRAQIAEVSPAYAAADAQVAPWYAGADAFQRAADVRGNNYTLDVLAGLIGGGAGFQQGIGSGLGGMALASGGARYARSPALARHLWEAGRLSEFLGRNIPARGAVALPILTKPASDNAR